MSRVPGRSPRQIPFSVSWNSSTAIGANAFQIVTLIVHPGPPGDAGPAAIDWAIMGDRGFEPDSAAALAEMALPIDRALPLDQRQRTHWGLTVLQADHTFDGGPVWAWDQFPLPDISTVTKSNIYQGPITAAALRAVHVALCRISKAYAGLSDPSHRGQRVAVRPDPRYSKECVSNGQSFLGGPLNARPQIRPGQRRPDLTRHTAADVSRLINCGDSQPGGTIKTTRSFMFVYDAHIHMSVATLPKNLVQTRGFRSFDEVPAGTALATRQGAVLFKTAPCGHGPMCSHGCGIAVWLTHGRLPKPTPESALSAKVPMADALRAAGEGARLDGVPEWAVTDFTEVPGTWQQVFVRTVTEGDALIQLVYWDFYNGAFSTTGCDYLVEALMWATDPARGNVKILALMGGGYFSNGVALNIIESADHPGRETWANINAIDDVVEVLAGDVTSAPRSEFLGNRPSLTERGILTVACLRGNAAAGGVALAAACDVVVSAGSVVLNPAYRAMGLHGSEFHLYSYVERCGRSIATHLVKDMLPLSAARARELGLVDVVVSGRDQPAAESEAAILKFLRNVAAAPASAYGSLEFPSAPWTKFATNTPSRATTLVERFCENKRGRYESNLHVPLVNYRHEELSQMLLDSFHPHRSQRYHSRRIKFVRKVKAEKTPTRFAHHRVHMERDEEETAAFDNAPGWVRGEEWSWVGHQTPTSMTTSQGLLIDFAAPVPPLSRPPSRRSSRSNKSFHSLRSHKSQPSIRSHKSQPSIRSHASKGSISSAAPSVQGSPSQQHTATFAGPETVETLDDSVPPVPALPEVTTPEGVKRRPSLLASVSSGSIGRSSTWGRSTKNEPVAPEPTPAPYIPSHLAVKAPKRRASSFLGRLAGAFRSKQDLHVDVPPTPRTPLSATRIPSGATTPTYARPTLVNEGNTDSPCLFNITGDDALLPKIDTRPQVLSV